MKTKAYAIIATLVAAILCGLTIYVGIRIVDLVKERDALKEAASAEATESKASGLVEIPTDEETQTETEELVFVEEQTNDSGEKVKEYRDSEHNTYKYNEDGRLIGTMSKPGAWSDAEALPDGELRAIATNYMREHYGSDFDGYIFTAKHNGRSTDKHRAYVLEYESAEKSGLYIIHIWDNGIVIWSQYNAKK